jgi:hypothetical protein
LFIPKQTPKQTGDTLFTTMLATLGARGLNEDSPTRDLDVETSKEFVDQCTFGWSEETLMVYEVTDKDKRTVHGNFANIIFMKNKMKSAKMFGQGAAQKSRSKGFVTDLVKEMIDLIKSKSPAEELLLEWILSNAECKAMVKKEIEDGTDIYKRQEEREEGEDGQVNFMNVSAGSLSKHCELEVVDGVVQGKVYNILKLQPNQDGAKIS